MKHIILSIVLVLCNLQLHSQLYFTEYSPVVVKVRTQADFLPVRSDVLYEIDAVQITIESLEVPTGGINIAGRGIELTEIVTTSDNATIFTSPVGGSGNVILQNLSLNASTTGSQVYDLTGTGAPTVELENVNYNNCVSLGEITNYRQGLELNTGRFGGTPSLTLSGNWTGGYFISTSIVRGLTDGVYALFTEGTSFTMQSRFKTNMNADLNSTVALLDFQSSNFPNPNTVQIEEAIISRNGTTNAADNTIIPNLSEDDLPSYWQDNIGIPNTYVGGDAYITAESQTTINSVSTFVEIEGTWATRNLVHFSSQNGNKELVNLAGSPREFDVRFNGVIDGGPNDIIAVKIQVWDNSAGTFVDYKTLQRAINNSQGGNDVGYFIVEDRVIVDINDYVRLVVANLTDTTNITVKVDSEISVTER